MLSTSRKAIAKAGISAAAIAAIGITNQRETTLIWERDTGRPIHRAIVWQDRRTDDRCQTLKSAGYEPGITAKTGLLLELLILRHRAVAGQGGAVLLVPQQGEVVDLLACDSG